MKRVPDWGNGRLEEYLGYKAWVPESGLRVIVGLDYYCKSDFEGKQANECPLAIDIWLETAQMTQQLSRLARRWHGNFGSVEEESRRQPPSFFIKFALEQNFRPEWLDWAIEKGCYTPENMNDAAEKVTKSPVTIRSIDAWQANARQIAEKIHKEKPSLNLEQIAIKTHKEMTDRNNKGEQGMTGRGGKIPCASTILRHAIYGIKS